MGGSCDPQSSDGVALLLDMGVSGALTLEPFQSSLPSTHRGKEGSYPPSVAWWGRGGYLTSSEGPNGERILCWTPDTRDSGTHRAPTSLFT